MTDHEIDRITAAIRFKYRRFPESSDEFVQIGLLGALQAETKYIPERAARLTFLRNKAIFAVQDWLREEPTKHARSSTKRVDLVSISSPRTRQMAQYEDEHPENRLSLEQKLHSSAEDIEKNADLQLQLRNLYLAVSESDRNVIDMYIATDGEQKVIARNLGVTAGRVSQRINRIRKVAKALSEKPVKLVAENANLVI